MTVRLLVFATVIATTGWSIFAAPASLSAQNKVPGSQRIDPAAFNFSIPYGDIRLLPDQRVLTTDEYGNGVVGLIHAMVGDNYLILLPNGHIVDRLADDVELTDREFEPAGEEELVAEIAVGKLAGFKSKSTRHYVFIYNTSDLFAETTMRILETMYRGVVGYAKNQKIETNNPVVPLVVIMFRTEKEFQAYQEMPAPLIAYYNMLNNYVVLREEVTGFPNRRDLAVGQALSTIAHEGAHQILHNIGVQQRLSLWPMWLSEGIAEYFAPTSFGRNYRWKGAGKINDLRMFELEMYMQNRSYKGLDGETVRRAVGATRLDSTGYAIAWSITHYLAQKRRREFKKYFATVSQLAPLEGLTARGKTVPQNLEHFKEFFQDDLPDFESKLVEHLMRQDYSSPVADAIHFVATVAIEEDSSKPRKIAAMFHLPQLAQKWQEDLLKSLDNPARGAVVTDIRQFDNRALANRYMSQWQR